MSEIIKTWRLVAEVETGDITKTELVRLLDFHTNKGDGVYVNFSKASKKKTGLNKPKLTLLSRRRGE